MTALEKADGSALAITRRALVTGASGGLGAAIAERLAARGYEVWLAARRVDALVRCAATICATGGRAHVLPIDLARTDEAHARLEELDREVGGIDLVVANAAIAGLPAAVPVERLRWQDVRPLLDVNLVGNIATVMAFVPGMLARGRGHIVGISSLLAERPSPRAAPYGASKAGLSHFLEAIGIELRARGIAVTVVHPGFMQTPAAEGVRDPMPFIVPADKAARLIERAIARKARKLTFPWAMAALIRAPGALPAALRDPVVRRISRERA